MSHVTDLIEATGRNRKELSQMLGYASVNSLRQAESGKQTLPVEKADWLERYALMRILQAEAEVEWLEQNPPPGAKRGGG